MIFHRLGLINKNQKGLTTLELLIVVVISSIMVGGTTTAIYQVFTGSTRSSNYMTAIRQVQNAGYWVSHDAQMAQSTNTTGVSGFPLTLAWTDWDDNSKEVVYSLENMSGGLKKLYRSYSINGTSQGAIVVAQYIDPAITSSNFTDSVLVLTVTATVGTGSQQESETRVYRVIPRPSL